MTAARKLYRRAINTNVVHQMGVVLCTAVLDAQGSVRAYASFFQAALFAVFSLTLRQRVRVCVCLCPGKSFWEVWLEFISAK